MTKTKWKRALALIVAVMICVGLFPVSALAAQAGEIPTGDGVIDVTDYGADPTGANESSSAVRAALDHAKTLNEGVEKTIYFPKGEYHFYADKSEVRELYVSNTVGADQRYKNKSLGILVEDMKNVTIDGSGSLFVFHGDMTAFAAIRSQNVTFQNFSVDFASPSVIDVMVESHGDNNTAILYVPPAYTYEIRNGNGIHWTVEDDPEHSGDNNMNYSQAFDTNTGVTWRTGVNASTYGPFSGVTAIEQISKSRLKVTYSGGRPQVGVSYQMRQHMPRSTPGAFFGESENVTVKDVNIHYLHGFGMVGQLSKDVTLDGVKFESRPGTGRTTAGYADFVQMSSVGGKVTIKNCDFSNPHDDPINIHGTFLEVTNVANHNKTFTLKYRHDQTGGFPQYYVGDEVDFSAKGSMAHVKDSLRTVTSVIQPGEAGNDLNTTIITLNEPVEGITAGNYVVENVTYTPEVLIENCRFAETPTRGILVTTRKPVVIRNNYFDRMTMAAIYISCDAGGWWESGRTENVTIEDNVFHINSSNAVFLEPTGVGAAGNRVHNNMTIRNNTIYMWGNVQPFNFKSAANLTIEGNRILRYDPNVALNLTADKENMMPGETQATHITSSGTSFGTKIYHFNSCENVTIKNNVYDDGLNPGASLSATDAGEIHVENDAAKANGDNQLPAVGKVGYYSTDPDVATVDANGLITGVGAGETKIYAYCTAAGRTFESEALTITVNGNAATPPSKIEITGGDTVNVDGTLNLTANVTGGDSNDVIWDVKPMTDGAAAAIDQSGVLTAIGTGVVEATASLGGVTASKLVTIGKDFDYLSDMEWVTATVGDSTHTEPCKDSSWTSDELAVTGADDQKVVFAKDLGVHADSDITYDLTGKGYTRLTAKVGASYAARSKNETNIRFLVLCDGVEKYTSGDAMGATTPYKEVDVTLTDVNTLLLKVVGVWNTYSAHGNWADARLYPTSDTNVAPTAENVTAAASNGKLTLTYDFTDQDQDDTEANSLITWYVSETEDGHYTRIKGRNAAELPVTTAISGKYVKAVVVPQDDRGRFGVAAASDSVLVPALVETPTDATLDSLSVAGLTLDPAFDPEVTEYTVHVPASATAVKIEAAAAQTSATVEGTGKVPLTDDETVAEVTATAPDGETTKTYAITICRAKRTAAKLTDLTATAGSESITFDPANRFYGLVVDENTNDLVFTATPAAGSTVNARYHATEKGALTRGETYTYPLVPGLNYLELRSIAEDGLSTALYRVRVLKPTVGQDATLKSLTVNDNSLPIKDENAVRVDGDTVTIVVEATDSNATVLINVDGKKVSSGEAVAITKPFTTVTVRVVAEDGATDHVYRLTLVKNDPSSARLMELDLGEVKLSPAFDPTVTEYTAVNSGFASTTLNAAAVSSAATIACDTLNDIAQGGTGSISTECNFYQNEKLMKDGKLYNSIAITVTSPDETAQTTYTIKVEVALSGETIPPLEDLDLPITGIAFGENEAHTIYTNKKDPGHTVTLQPKLTPVNATETLIWKSSDESVATVEDGVVTAVAPGTATITACASSQPETLFDTCTITVKEKLAGKVSISGGSQIGVTLTADVSDFAPGSIDIQWQRKGSGNAAFAPIAGATAGEYTVPVDAANVGATYRVAVTGKGTYEGTVESSPITMDRADNPTAPTGLVGVDCSAADNHNGKITGLDRAENYEYSSDGGATWKTVGLGGDEIADLAAGTYLVRFAETATHTASPAVSVTITYPGAPVYAITLNKPAGCSVTLTPNKSRYTSGEQVTLTVTGVKDTDKATVAAEGVTFAGTGKNTWRFSMPAENLTITVTVISVPESVKLNKTRVRLIPGETVTLEGTLEPANAEMKGFIWVSDNSAVATVDDDGVVTALTNGTATITAKAIGTALTATCEVTVTTSGGSSGGSTGGGSSTPSETTKTETRDDGSKVTTVTKPDGTVTETVEQPDGSKSETVTTKNGDVTITVTDPEGKEVAKVEIPATIPETKNRFDDVPEGHWADEAIHNAAALKLVEGIGDNKYDMVSPMTRGSLATVLHRLSQGKTDYETTFKDVAQGKYYTEGVAWAAKAKVVTGYTDEIFAPDDVITREQLAVMLCRYAKLIGMDTKADSKALDQFVDGDTTGDWAVDGVAWCVENSILKGKGNDTLDPAADITRAEVAVMLDRFIGLLK